MFKSIKKGYVSYVLVLCFGLFMSALAVSASTTISTNIDTGGNITVAPAYGLDASSAGVLNIGTTTATTINIGGTQATTKVLGLLQVPAAYGLDVSSAGVLNVGTTTATSINIGKAGVPVVMVNASSTLANFGGGTTVSKVLFGTCTPTVGSLAATSTVSVICTNTGGVEVVDSTAYKVFVTPYITEGENISFVSASSTALGIQVTVLNRNLSGVGAVNPTDNVWSWMAIK